MLTLASVDAPLSGDLDESVGNVAFQEPYSLRTALAAEGHPLAVGVIHSHPRDCPPEPSFIDDDMDGYYSQYFESFAPGRPYVSLIVSVVSSALTVGGRVHWNGEWISVVHVAAAPASVSVWRGFSGRAGNLTKRTERLQAAFGEEAAARLKRSTVAIIGAGGTGSAAVEVLARAGVGRLIVVDPDHLEESNLERVHGSKPRDAKMRIAKAAIAKRHAKSIDPTCQVQAYVGALPQEAILDALVSADVAIGCTDQQHSRLALSDLALRYLVPVLDCGVVLEGAGGRVSGQVVQIVRFLPADPCALCRRMIDPVRVSQELMSEPERSRRQIAAREAAARGERAGAYWRDEAQINTVGYLTTLAGSLVAGYAIGWITGRFDPPFSRMQLNLAAKFLDVTDSEDSPRSTCSCRQYRGWADQAAVHALVTAPSHWPVPKLL